MSDFVELPAGPGTPEAEAAPGPAPAAERPSPSSNVVAPPPRPVDPAAFCDERTYAATRAPVDAASTLIPDAYTTVEFFAQERERVFATSWVAVGCTSEVATTGACIVAEVAGRSVVVTRDRDGGLHAFHNVCRHRAARLLDVDATHVGRSNRIRCPYHSWTYGLDGTCLGTPLFEGSDVPEGQEAIFDTSAAQEFDRADHGLLTVAVDTWGFLVFVNLEEGPAPLAEQLGDLPRRLAGYDLERWTVQRTATYEIAANHKLIGENYMEYYHLPWVHPELNKVSKFSDHYRWQGRGMYSGMCTTPVSRNGDAGGWDGLAPVRGLDPDDADSGRFVWLFPNTALTVLPNHAFMLFNRPVGPGRTVETAVLLCHPDSIADAEDHEAGLDQLMAFWDLVNLQDVEIVERVQQGLENPAYRGGRMCFRFEEPLHRYQNMVIDRMVGLRRVPEGDAETSTPMFEAP